jgi:hypothetical protein
MRRSALLLLVLSAFAAAPVFALESAAESSLSASKTKATLKGSPASMERQNRVAKSSAFAFMRTAAQVLAAVARGELVVLEGNRDYGIAGAGFPFARPEIRTFIERLSAQHRSACGERLVVTSLTRPTSLQPSNASPLSVHPAGMAVDLRVSGRAACRGWLERTLLALESRGVLDATREHNPPHYHVAVFPTAYARYMDDVRMKEVARVKAERERIAQLAFAERMTESVRRGDALADAFAAATEPRIAVVSGEYRSGVNGGLLSLLALAPLAVYSLWRRRPPQAQEARD